MKKQQYINILEEVVLRPPNKMQECSFQVKIINSSAAFFKDFAYSFCPFIFKNSQVSLLSSNNLSFFDYPTNKYLFRVNNRKSREWQETFSGQQQKQNQYFYCRLKHFFVGYAVCAKVSQPALVYSKSITKKVEQSVHWRCPWCLSC